MNRRRDGKVTECRYVPHHLVEDYLIAGWTIESLNCHHGAYSVLASRNVPDDGGGIGASL